MSPAALFGQNKATTTGLTWGYYGGAVIVAGVPTIKANATIALTASATNYIEYEPVAGTVGKNTSGWTSGSAPLYRIVVGASSITSWQDFRSMTLATAP